MNGNRLLFGAIVAVLAVLVIGTLLLSTGTPGGPEGLAVLARTLIGVGIVLLLIRLARRTFGGS